MATMAAVPARTTSLGSILEQVAKEKGIDKKILVETIEAAILKAAQSVFGPTRELEARFNEETGQVDLFQYMTVVEVVAEPEREISLEAVEKHKLDATIGEELGFQVFWRPEDAEKAREQDKEFGDILKLKQARTTFGRIAAQTAKQVLLQRVRDAERDLIFNEYKDRKGELIRGIVRRFEKGNNIIVDLGSTEGVLPFREQTPARDVPARRSHRRLREGHRPRGPRPAGHPVALGSAPRREALRGRGARDLRGHRRASSPSPASRAPAARSPSPRATRTSIRWAPASA